MPSSSSRLLFYIRPNSLLSLWYCLGSVLLQAWLLYLGFERYRLYTEMQWPTGAYPQLWLTIYISLLAACLPLLALFLAFGLLKLGNLASDNEQLGARSRRAIQLVKGGQGAARARQSFSFRLCHCLRSGWTHGPPAAQSLHLLLALVQLFAQQCMLAQLYRFGFINSGDFLNSELDFAFQRARQLATNLPMGETRLQSFRITSEELAASPLAPNLLPILMHARLFGIPLEFANLVLALVAFSAVYPAVFWRSSRAFSVLFSLFLLVHSANIVWTYLGFSLLFRIQETNFYSPRPVGMGQHLWALRTLPLFHPLALVAGFWLVLGLMHLAPVAIYVFGYAKFVASQARLRRQRRRRLFGSSSSASPPPGAGESCSSAGGGDQAATSSPLFCDGLSPHVFAVTLLLLVAAAKAPAFYALGMLYYKEERPFLLCCVMADLVYMFVWMLLWCLLILKCQWRFRVHFDVHELISLQDAHKMADGIDFGGGGENNGNSGKQRWRSPAELKNALLLVQGDNMFLTDDPVAKPAIVRQLLRSCAAAHQQQQQQQQQGGEAVPGWLRSAAGGIQQQSAPGTQSPQRRPPLLLQNNIGGGGFMAAIGQQRTPDLACRQLRGQQQQQPMAREESPVPLAAPPYQRMASLPPLFLDGQQPTTMMAANNSFGTLQTRQRHNNNASANGNDYSAFAGSRQQLQQQQQQQMAGTGTLSRSFNASQQQQQQSQQSGIGMPNLATGFYPPPESYATIHRRCSKSSVGSSAAGGAAAAGIYASNGCPNPGTASAMASAVAASPQLMRSARAASLVPSSARNGQHQQQPMPMAQQNGGGHFREAANGHEMPLLLNGGGAGSQLALGQQQQQQQSNGYESTTMAGRLFESVQQRQQQQQQPRMPMPLTNGGNNELQLLAKEAAAKQQQRQGQGHHQPQSTFGGPMTNGVWQQESGGGGGGLLLLENGGGSQNGGGTGTPSGSVTVGSSRVGSAASSSAASQTTFEAPANGGGGFSSSSFGHQQQAAIGDYGTLTRAMAKEGRGGGGDLTLIRAQQQQRTTAALAKEGAGGQWRPGAGKLSEAAAEFATSVV